MSRVEWLDGGAKAIHHIDDESEKGKPGYRPPIHFVRRGGIYFHKDTPVKVAELLNRARREHAKVRLFFGDTKTGRDWNEENDVTGFIGCSMGPLKVPLLVRAGSDGGPALLDHCIVKIVLCGGKGKRGFVLYQHRKYDHGVFTLRAIQPGEKIGNEELLTQGYTHAVDIDGQNHANFKSITAAARWIAKMTLDDAEPTEVPALAVDATDIPAQKFVLGKPIQL